MGRHQYWILENQVNMSNMGLKLPCTTDNDLEALIGYKPCVTKDLVWQLGRPELFFQVCCRAVLMDFATYWLSKILVHTMTQVAESTTRVFHRRKLTMMLPILDKLTPEAKAARLTKADFWKKLPADPERESKGVSTKHIIELLSKYSSLTIKWLALFAVVLDQEGIERDESPPLPTVECLAALAKTNGLVTSLERARLDNNWTSVVEWLSGWTGAIIVGDTLRGL